MYTYTGDGMETRPSVQLVDREHELNILADLLKDAAEGRSSIALMTGPTGSGKTQLMQTFCKRAEEHHATVLTAVASPAERSIPLGVMDQLFRSEALPREFRHRVGELLTEELSTSRVRDPILANQPSIAVAHGLRSVLLELGRRGPVVMSIDDLQFADGPSLQMLLFLQRRTKASRTLLLLAEAPTIRSPHPVFHAELFRQPNCHKIRLEMFTRVSTHAMIRGRLGPAKAMELTDAYHEASGGSPLFLSALLDDHEAAHRTLTGFHRSEPAVPDEAFRNALTGCLFLAGPAVLEVACTVAAMEAEGTSPASIAHILGRNTATVEHAIATLTATGVLRSGRFRHPAARTAVLEQVPPDRRHELHLRVATVLQNEGAPPVAVAEQLVAANRAPEGWMINVLREAARTELAAGRTETAGEYLKLALTYGTDGRQLGALIADRMRLDWRTSPLRAMRHTPWLKDAMRRGHLSGQDSALLVRSLLWHGRYAEARESLTLWEEDEARSHGFPSEELSTFNRWVGYTHPSLVAAPEAAPAPGTWAEGRQRAGGTPVLGARACVRPVRSSGRKAINELARLLAQGPDDDTLTTTEGVLHSVGLGDGTFESLHAALLALLCADHPDKAAAWSEELLKVAAQHGATCWQAVFAAVRAEAALRQGDMTTAVRHGEAALAQLSPTGWGVALGSPLATLILAHTHLGQYEQAAQYVRLPVPDVLFDSRYGLHYLHARGQFHLSRNRPGAALADFESCGRLMEEWGIDLPSLVPWRGGAAEALLTLGHGSRARLLVEEQLRHPGNNLPRARGASLRILAAASDPSDRPTLLHQAVRLLHPDVGRFELARTMADLADAYRESGDPVQARTMADRAAGMLRSCRVATEWEQPSAVPGPVHPPEPEPVPVEEGPDGAELLTDAERRVAELAAVGATNRAIGRKLYITTSTVEQHLTRVYRKLNVSRRGDLALRLNIVPAGAESA
ncbi:AAA family ATPase [Streptomyces sp. NPDC002490]|uniref:helix-turn-helix transcriptional regulator n=1 Tax=Streptomyces sp. NPDC002490 TaxID=3154416 RepID=UPI0033286E70